MSQTATARPLRRPVAHRAPERHRRLHVVTATAPRTHVGFAVACLLIVVSAFVGALVLNTALVQGTYTLKGLQDRSDLLGARSESLTESLVLEGSTGRLVQRAGALGMVQAPSVAYLSLADGRVLGVAEAASAADRLTVAGTAPAPDAAPSAAGKAPAETVVTKGTTTTTTTTTVKGTTTTTVVTVTDSAKKTTRTTTTVTSVKDGFQVTTTTVQDKPAGTTTTTITKKPLPKPADPKAGTAKATTKATPAPTASAKR